MLQDHRITAGAELDGGVSERVAAAGLHAPFMVISGNSSAGHPKTEENLTALWPNLTDWNRWLRLRNAGHLTFTDFEVFAPELHTPPATQQQFGTIDPVRAVTIERAYLLAFFTQQLDHHHQRILDTPSKRYPEMIFER
jgi:hypothetical protein